MSAAALRPPIAPDDRFALTLCLAIIVHVMVVLGVSFAPEPKPRPKPEGLEVTLVAQRSEEAPEQADLLAQANLRGGGDSQDVGRPAAPIATPLPAPLPAVAATPPPAAPAPELPLEPAVPREPVAAARAPARPRATERAAPPPKRLTTERAQPTAAPEPVAKPDPEPAAPAEQAAEATPATPTQAQASLPTAQQLITRSFALASLNSELQQKLDTHAKRPRQKFISANTQEYRYAAYMEAWRAKVERIGNLNYPDEARQKQLSGALLLDVALRPDGSVIEILVRRSSGHKVLDDAAVRIVELAAPFAPFPEDILKEVDILHVTRTWKFLNTAEFAAQ
jgi:periplasmic protein TonB